MFSKLKKLLGVCRPKEKIETKPTEEECLPDVNEDIRAELPEKKSVKQKKSNGIRSKSKQAGKTSSGMRKIEADEDLYDLFGGESIDLEIEITTVAEKKPPVRKTTRAPQKKSGKLNKRGVLVIDVDDDLLKMFESAEEEDLPRKGRQTDKTAETSGEKRLPKKLKDKHGIPILKEREDYTAFFNDEIENGEKHFKRESKEEDFAILLDESLGGKITAVLLREKKDSMDRSKPITLKQRIKRYPSPQGQLDLHGFTAMQAELRTETYVKNAFKSGTYTIRIIVGKGLHSKEGAVLPDVVEDKLIRLKNEGVVLTWEWENKTKSKSGAVIVYLNNYYIPE